MSAILLLPSTVGNADAGMIVLQGGKAHAMSGSNAICLVTVMLETSIVEMTPCYVDTHNTSVETEHYGRVIRALLSADCSTHSLIPHS